MKNPAEATFSTKHERRRTNPDFGSKVRVSRLPAINAPHKRNRNATNGYATVTHDQTPEITEKTKSIANSANHGNVDAQPIPHAHAQKIHASSNARAPPTYPFHSTDAIVKEHAASNLPAVAGGAL